MKISVVTVTYNDSLGLSQTLKSVKGQDHFDVEHLVIDGGSQDGSIELLQSQAETVKWISESDKGIYDAMNKGIQMASGEYCIFINSGDLFYDNQVLSRFCNLNPEAVLVYGDCEVTGRPQGNFIKTMPKAMDLLTAMGFTVTHQAIFYQTKYMKSHPFDLSYSIIADWVHFNTALFYDKVDYLALDWVVSSFDGTGFSSDPAQLEQREAERTMFYNVFLPRILSEVTCRKVKVKVGSFRKLERSLWKKR